ncbi:MAG: hypothetical protein MJE77_26185 [Proteobacteria bacterium]|nr:hypothetical protein [Pseudomonadota bacterium]
MPTILSDNAVVTCAHQGKDNLVASNRRVTVNGSAVLTKADLHPIAGCTPPPNAGGPCTTASFTTAATRVKVGGQPLLLRNNVALCTPTGTPLSVVLAQLRVKAQ